MAEPYPQVVLFGDSLIERTIEAIDGYSFFDALQIRCIRRLDVVNRGFSGWNTANALEYLPKIFPERNQFTPRLEYLIVLLGANDAVLPMPMTWQHVPVDEYKENLIKIITHPNIQAHKPKILLVTPPPLDEVKVAKLDVAEGYPSAIRRSGISAEYAEKVREITREHPDVTLVDLWQAIMDKAIEMAPADYQPGGPWLGSPENGKQGGLDILLPDGLHLGADGYRVFWQTIKSHIGQAWATLSDDERRAGYIYPDWRTFKPKE